MNKNLIISSIRDLAKKITASIYDKYMVNVFNWNINDNNDLLKKIQDVNNDFLSIKDILKTTGFKFISNNGQFKPQSKQGDSPNDLKGVSYVWEDEDAGFDVRVNFITSESYNFSLIDSIDICEKRFQIITKIYALNIHDEEGHKKLDKEVENSINDYKDKIGKLKKDFIKNIKAYNASLVDQDDLDPFWKE